jgi:uncharacterized protein YeaO (DUF488 family)
MSVAIKRLYEKPAKSDGHRILVDGLWPRGFNRSKLQVERWLREIAPSAALRKWYGHQPKKWDEFRRRYRQELAASPRKELVEELVKLARQSKVTLVFAAKDAERSNAAVLQETVSALL